jgi:tetratricopeptide (TPR) repeat protein
VLENFLKRGRDSNPPVREAFLAIGRLALDKHDYGLASRTFLQGLDTFNDDPDLWAGLAAAFINGERTKLQDYAEKALALNEHHAGARLLLAENLIDSERFDEADAEIAKVLEANPHHPAAHALRSVLAHLRADPEAAVAARNAALATWKTNPEVDTLIGRKLAQRGFHGEAAVVLRRALEFDPLYTPARIELAQALLRSGREREGWALAAAVHADDGYDINAFNLTNLHDRLQGFATIATRDFELRMGVDEAPIYGDRAIALLEEAQQVLTAKYGVELDERTAVEIFPNPNDFSVRTFGVPGGPPAYLGVCFGPLVTVNSPASKHTNWEATLWHEYAHTITLKLSRHRVPRWLTEGISVYEEVQMNPAWGQRMSVDYYHRIVEGRTQPISRMSAAFLEAEKLEDVVFAYYQSYLVVQFLVDTYGFEALRATLVSLGEGTAINDALALHFAPLAELDEGFATYARAEADQVASGFDLSPPRGSFVDAVAQSNRRNLFGQLQRAREMLESGRGLEARFLLRTLAVEGFYLPGPGNVHRALAQACRDVGDLAGEKAALTTIAEHEGDALEAVSRLLEIAQEEDDPEAAARWADHWVSINPIAPTPWRALFTAHEERHDAAAAIAAGNILLKLDPPDRVSVHYRLARLMETTAPADARLHVLQALEEAPRFRAAHALLAKLPLGPGVGMMTSPSTGPTYSEYPVPISTPTATPTTATP